MDVLNFLSDVDYSIQLTDSIVETLDKFEEYKTHHLAVLDGNKYLGFISEEDAFNFIGDGSLITSLNIQTTPIFVQQFQHPYNALLLLNTYKTSFVVVIDSEGNFIGTVTPMDLLQAVTLIQSQNEVGAIIEIEVEIHDDSLSHLSRIIENENARIINYSSRLNIETNKVEITLKLDKSEISAILSSLARQKYEVLHTYNTQDLFNDTEDRYNQFMKYLDI